MAPKWNRSLLSRENGSERGKTKKVFGLAEDKAVTDIRRDACNESARLAHGNMQYGRLEAHWGYGTAHDGECYEVHLCERRLFATLTYLKQERRIEQLFDDDARPGEDELCLVNRNDWFRDGS